MSQLRTLALTDEERSRARLVQELGSRGDDALAQLLPQLDDPSWAVRRAVVIALGAIGQAAVKPLCDILRHRRESESRLAATVDALVASRGSVDAELLGMAESSEPAIASDAVQILGRRRSVAAVQKLAELTTAQDDNLALAAIEALGRIGGEAVTAPLITAVESRNFFRAFPAIDVLGRTGSARAVKPLLPLLAEARYTVEVARALGRIGDPSAIVALAELLGKPSDASVRTAAVALSEIHERQTERFGAMSALGGLLQPDAARHATQRMVQCMRRADPGEQTALVRVLSLIGGEAAAVALVDLLAAEHEAAQAAASALARLGRSAEPLLLASLQNGDSERRLTILPLLSHRTDVAGPVAECLSDPNPNVRALACDALARVGETSLVPRIFELLRDPDARVTQSAVAAIQSLGSAETERLAVEAAQSTDLRVRRAGLRIIAYFGYESAIDVLLTGMSDPDERIRDTSIFGLPFLDDPRAIEALIGATKHASARTRAAGMRALGQVSAQPRTLDAIRPGLHDPDAWVRYFACQSLSRLGDEPSADTISLLMSDPAGQVRVAVVEALAHLRGARALVALQGAAVGDDPDVQRAALLGLGNVKDPSSLPVLRQALHGADAATRLVAVSALAEFESAEIVHDLDTALSDSDEGVRSAALSLLAARPGPEATRVLVGQLTSRSLQSRIVAALAQSAEGRIEELAQALRSATSETAPLLVSALVRAHRSEATLALEDAFATQDVTVRRAVAPALAAMSTGTSRALLARAAREDPDEEVRRISNSAAR